ncbi:hypothetical protein M426DRAFT_72086 [Hypoxylon sp. CI-4A]|nr:hypothetical protein M426DRAFT_72086 [Hypoxylon sp. CI-4A]
MKCEIKHLDLRWNNSEQFYAERKDGVDKPEQKDWWRLFAFCLVKVYFDDEELDTTRLYVNHQPLRQLLKDVIGDFPDDPIDVDDVQIEDPYHSLFYYRKELEAQGLSQFEDDEDSAAQLKLLLGWIKTHFEAEITAYEKCTSGSLKAISFDHLWTLFPPDKILYAKILGQHRGFRLHNSYYEEDDDSTVLSIRSNYVDFDGDKIGNRRASFTIPKYQGTRQLQELDILPLDLVEDGEEIRAELVTRGRKFENYVGQHYEQYDGIGLKKTEQGYARINVKGRVMIDCETYHRLEANDTFEVMELGRKERFPIRTRRNRPKNDIELTSRTKTFDKLSDDDAAIASATVRGFAFSIKQFLEFFVEHISPIEWNTRCFDELVLDPATKKTVQAVVATHSRIGEEFDDIIKGKGQGLVCVLHGPPGVGKTLTAECVAEYIKQPLYMVSSGDLGVSSSHLDANLTRIMDLAQTWKAVLLIDEADVFLEQRSLHDLHRNAMVSVFLRALEYYTGILLMTTNRVTTFDDGFKSRIHVPIRYTDLGQASRLRIWRSLCDRVPGGVDVDGEGLSSLAQNKLNGRQIKNIIKAAESLAAFDGVRVDYAQLTQVARIQEAFEKDLARPGGVDYAAPGEARKDDYNMFL